MDHEEAAKQIIRDRIKFWRDEAKRCERNATMLEQKLIKGEDLGILARDIGAGGAE